MSILSAIEERVYNRRERWQTEEADMLPDPMHIGETCICGIFSLSCLSSKRRIIRQPDCILTEAGLETPSTIARDYLTLKYQHSPRIKHQQRLACQLSMPTVPLLARPGDYPKLWYLDVRAAYWSLLNKAGWDVDYWPGQWLAPGIAPTDFPFPQNKVSRNCLVSSAMPGKMTLFSKPHKAYITRATKNPLVNLQIVRLIRDTLMSLATEMREAGAVYIHTDGYIFEEWERMAQAVERIAAWGLQARLKFTGPGWIRGAGVYRVGRHSSKAKVFQVQAIDTIEPLRYHDWLRERVKWAQAY